MAAQVTASASPQTDSAKLSPRDFAQTFLTDGEAAVLRWMFLRWLCTLAEVVLFLWPPLPPFLSSAPRPLGSNSLPVSSGAEQHL